VRLEAVRGEPDDLRVDRDLDDCPVSVLLSDDLALNWTDARSIEKMILRCLKEPGFLRTA
jgi:hypothetical protein